MTARSAYPAPRAALDIAVVGMSGRFPGAASVGDFWANLRAGANQVVRLPREQMLADGVPATLLDDPDYVPARGFLDGCELFDAQAFGYSPGEAELIDPQHRLLLECASAAVEEAALGGDAGARIGVFAGTSLSRYLLAMVASPELRRRLDPLTMSTMERDCAATRVAYKLDLTGPAVTIQTACSTSLVAVHMACAALRRGECDAALAGGASVSVPRSVGYRYEPGGPFSPDGCCRPFDARAAGAVPGDGVALVVLRRLEDAIADGDTILAVIKGTAVNNDGAAKVGYTAPGVAGQVGVITAALRSAGMDAADIGYVEAHGTATKLGDLIEIEALTEAFRAFAVAPGTCAIGSAKSGVGHLDTAAGVTGLIKTALQLHHRELVSTVHFEAANPALKLDQTPFRVSDCLRPWPAVDGKPRRAGVSAFGVGGTNAHAVLEEYVAPSRPAEAVSSREHIVVLSAESSTACVQARAAWRAALAEPQRHGASLTDIAYSAATGRRQRRQRWFTVAGSTAELLDKLGDSGRDPVRAQPLARSTVFAFPGVGSQYGAMARTLYRTEPTFARALDSCAELLAARHRIDLERLLAGDQPDTRLTDPVHAVSALFSVEYALARLLDGWGVIPDVVLGHSTGEYAAACVAGVLAVDDALSLLVLRAGIAARAGDGAMLQVGMPEAELSGTLPPDLAIAAVNAPDRCVVAGRRTSVEQLAQRLAGDGIGTTVVPVRGAGHSPLIEPYLPEFRAACAQVRFAVTRIPMVSTATGSWLAPGQATDPDHWVGQFRTTVRFADAVATVLSEPRTVLILGPGRAHAGWMRRMAPRSAQHLILPCLPDAERAADDRRDLLEAIGRYWSAGGEVRWRDVYAPQRPRRIPLPPYAFQRSRYWALDADPSGWRPGLSVASLPMADDAAPAEAGLDRHHQSGRAYDRPDLDVEFVEPRGERERMLAGLWGQFFGIARVGVRDDFFELGGDSLLAVRLAAALSERTGRTVLPVTVVRSRTIARLAAALDEPDASPDDPVRRPEPAVGPVAAADGGQPPLVAAAQAACLRVAAAMRPRSGPRSGDPHVVLVGATGHLGPYLLRELLSQQELPVTVLLRAEGAAHAVRRLRETMAARLLWARAVESRVDVLAADLRKARFGLSDRDWRRAAAGAVAIYHCAADVNFIRPYDQLEAANVGGVETVMRLAADSGEGGHLHFMSTLGVLQGADPADKPYPESPLSLEPGRLPNGYAQSKWVAEHVVNQAAGLGLTASIYRVCGLAGDSATGYCNVDDLFWRVIRTALRTGLAPLRDAEMVSLPVDCAAEALVAMSLHSPGTLAHLAPEPVTWRQIWEWVRRHGVQVTEVPFDAWQADLVRRVGAGEQLALAPLVSALGEVLPMHRRRFDAAVGGDLLRRAGRHARSLDERSFAASLDYLIELDSRPSRGEFP